MKYIPPQHITPTEQKAAELWAGFSRDAQAAFWINYETTLETTRAQRLANLPPQAPKKKVRTKIYAPSGKSLVGVGFGVFISLVFGIGAIAMGTQSSSYGNIIHAFIMAGITLLMSGIGLWKLNWFEVKNEGLIIYKVGKTKHKTFRWDEIKRAGRYKFDDKDMGVRLVVVTPKKKYAYFDHLTDSDQQQFYTTLKKRLTK